MNPVAGYIVCEEYIGGDTAVVSCRFDEADDALKLARAIAARDQRDYYVCKLVPTHFIKHPVMPEPEVQEVTDVAVAL